jgi:hypothetical protein
VDTDDLRGITEEMPKRSIPSFPQKNESGVVSWSSPKFWKILKFGCDWIRFGSSAEERGMTEITLMRILDAEQKGHRFAELQKDKQSCKWTNPEKFV